MSAVTDGLPSVRWAAAWPLPEAWRRPWHVRDPERPTGLVVYTLHGPDGPLYVGSTNGLRGRLRCHAQTITFTHWDARPGSFTQEAELIAELRPPLNRWDMRSAIGGRRPGVVL